MPPSHTAAMPGSAPPSSSVEPWYRQKWPWLLMAGPGIVVVASFVSGWLALSTDDAIVADDYYKRGLSINQRLERVSRAAALGMTAKVDLAPEGGVRVALSSPSTDMDATPAVVVLGVAHETRGGLDRTVELVRGPDGAYAGRIDPIGTGRWLVSIETNSWRLPAVEIAGDKRSLELGTAGPPPVR
jgi:uncharacterized protein